MIKKRVRWCTRWALLALPLGLLPYLVVYVVLSRDCHVTHGLSRPLRRRRTLGVILKIFFGLACAAAGWLAISSMENRMAKPPYSSLYALLGIACVLIVAIFVVDNTPRLRVVRHRKGLFWIKGFSREYLASFPAPEPLYDSLEQEEKPGPHYPVEPSSTNRLASRSREA